MFEIVRQDELEKWNIKYEDVIIPTRKTQFSAGYDFHIPKNLDIEIPNEKGILIPTGIKCRFPFSKDKLYLQLSLKSGISSKNPIIMRNAPGIIDFDYVDNPDNDGHILISVYNVDGSRVNYTTLKGGTGIAQGIFVSYHTFGENVEEKRVGGFGSTSK